MAADEDLKARLKDHSKAFEGLMSLIPADYYYGKDNSDQWQRTKQTKEEKRAAKKAKLEPGAYKTALDVHREREQQAKDLKRKRDAGDEDEHATEQDTEQPEEPNAKKVKTEDGQEVKSKKKKNKKRPTTDAEEEEQVRQEKADKRREKNRERKERKKDEAQKKRERREARKLKEKEAKSSSDAVGDAKSDSTPPSQSQQAGKKLKKSKAEKAQKPAMKSEPVQSRVEDDDEESEADGEDRLASDVEFEGLEDASVHAQDAEKDVFDSPSVASSPEQENLFDNSTNHSSASSSSSVVPPSNLSDTVPELKPTSRKTTTVAAKKPVITSVDADDESEDESDSGSEVFDAKVDLPTEEQKPTQQSASKSKPQPRPATSAPPKSPAPQSTSIDSNPHPQQFTADDDDAAQAQFPKIDREALTKRLEDKLAALRAARKADGPNGKPAKNRAELIEARRKKADLRKQRKKEQRAKDREAKDAETEAARLRGGNGSPVWSPSLYSPGGALANQQEPNFQFGKVAFDDGAEVDANAGLLKDGKKKKGKSDAKTALLSGEKKKARLAGYDATKRDEIEEKDAWAAAKNRVSGEKGKDDTTLLKKTIKNTQKAKTKSEKEWNERIEGVKKGQDMRQQKREDNLRKRKEMKGVKGKDRKKLLGKQKGGGVQKPKQRKRPGFEGTFKTAARRT